jgi:hypothetical protein
MTARRIWSSSTDPKCALKAPSPWCGVLPAKG